MDEHQTTLKFSAKQSGIKEVTDSLYKLKKAEEDVADVQLGINTDNITSGLNSINVLANNTRNTILDLSKQLGNVDLSKFGSLKSPKIDTSKFSKPEQPWAKLSNYTRYKQTGSVATPPKYDHSPFFRIPEAPAGDKPQYTMFPSSTGKDLSPQNSSGWKLSVPTKSDIQAIEDYNQKMAGLRDEIDGRLKQSMSDLYNGIKKTDDEAEKSTGIWGEVVNSLKQAPNAIDGVTKAFKNLDFTKLVYLGYLVKRVTSSIYSTVESAADYEEALNLYTMALGEYADEAKRWEENISEKLMLDPADIMKYTGAFFNLTKGLGATGDAANLMSKNLTQLTYDMASYLNISNDAAQAKIQSAMAGQSRAVATVGVATQIASLQELAYSLNIKKKVKDMTQAEKTYLRYIQLMRSTTQMQGDLGRTMITPANAIRTLRNQIEMLGRAIGQVLTPLVMKAIPVIMAFANVLRQAAQVIAGFLGYELADVDFTSAISFEGAEDGVENLNALGGAAKSAADSVRNSLAPFDELNQVMFENSKGGSGGGGGASSSLSGTDWDALLPSYDMLKDYTGELADKAKALEGPIGKIAAALGGFVVLSKIGGWIGDISDWLTKVTDKFPTLGSFLTKLISWVGIIGGSLATLFSTGKLLNGAIELSTTLGGKWNDVIAEAELGAFGFQTALLAILYAFNPIAGVVGTAAVVVYDFVQAIDGYNAGLDNLIQKDYFGTLNVTTKQWLDILKSGAPEINNVSQYIKDADEALKTLYAEFQTSDKAFTLYDLKLSTTGKLTKDEMQGMKDTVSDMCDTTSKMIDTKTKNDLLIWSEAFKGTTSLSEDEQKSILTHIQTYGDQQKSSLKTTQDGMHDIIDTAIKERRNLTDEEKAFLEKAFQELEEITRSHMSSSNTDIEYYKRQGADMAKKLDIESYGNLNKALKTYNKEKLKEISDNYNTLYNEAEAYHKQNASDTETYYNMLKIADENREKALAEHEQYIKQSQDNVYANLVEVYNKVEGKTDDESVRTREKIAAIFKDAEIDDKHLLEIFGKAGTDSSNEWLAKFKQEQNSPKVKSGWAEVGDSAANAAFNGYKHNVATNGVDTMINMANVLADNTKYPTVWNKITGMGNYITQGVFKGMTSNLGPFAGSFANDLIAKVMKKLKINSPSKLVIDKKIGDYIVQGMEVGMYHELDKGIDPVVDTMMDTMQDAVDASNNLDFGEKLSAGIEEVSDGFKTMNDEILEFNKNASNIAINSTISANRKLTSDYSDIIGLVSGSYATNGNTATELIDNVKESVSNNTIVVQIGDEVVYKGQGEYQSRESDRYGTSYVKI